MLLGYITAVYFSSPFQLSLSLSTYDTVPAGAQKSHLALMLHHRMSDPCPTVASISTGSYSVRPAPRTKSRRLINHVVYQLRVCTLNEVRDNGHERQIVMEPCIEHLSKCIHACLEAGGSAQELGRLREDVVEADQEIIYFLVRAVDAVYAQCDQILYDTKNVQNIDSTAASSVRVDGAMVDKAKLELLQSWLSAQLSGRGAAAASVHPKTTSHSSSRKIRLAHNTRLPLYSGTHPRGGRKDARSGRDAEQTRPFAGISSPVLRASGRHPVQAPLNHDLSGVLGSARIEKPPRGRKRSEIIEAKRQNQLVEDMVDWWKAKDGWEREERKKMEEQAQCKVMEEEEKTSSVSG